MEQQRFKRLGALFIGFVALFAVVFGFFYVYVDGQNKQTIENIGDEYASMVNNQVSSHFETITDLRFDDLELAAQNLLEYPGEQGIYSSLNHLTQAGFQQVAFYTSADTFIFLSGGEFEPYFRSSFLDLVPKGELDISSGISKDGEKVIVLTTPCLLDYQGQDVIALVSTMPVSYFERRLQLEGDPEESTSLFVRSDGTFVIKDVVEYEDQDYSSIYDLLDKTDPEVSQELHSAIENRQDYSAIVTINQLVHIYASPLPHSYWYLVSIVPYGRMDYLITELQVTLFIGGLVAASAFLVGAFILYYYLRKIVKDQDVMLESEMHRNEVLQNRERMLEDLNQNLVIPLNGIVTLSGQALEQSAPKRQAMLHDIHDISEYILSRLNQIISPVPADSLSTFDVQSLQELVEKASGQLEPVLRLKHQHLVIDVGPVFKEKVYCDPRRIERVIRNLLTCASENSEINQTIRLLITQKQSHVAPDFVTLTLSCQLDKKVHSLSDLQDYNPLKLTVEKAGGTLNPLLDPVQLIITLDVEAIRQQPEYPELKGRVLLVSNDENRAMVRDLLEALGLEVTVLTQVKEPIENLDTFDIALLDEALNEADSEMLYDGLLDADVPFKHLAPTNTGRNPNGYLFKPYFYSSIYPILKRMLERKDGLPE